MFEYELRKQAEERQRDIFGDDNPIRYESILKCSTCGRGVSFNGDYYTHDDTRGLKWHKVTIGKRPQRRY